MRPCTCISAPVRLRCFQSESPVYVSCIVRANSQERKASSSVYPHDKPVLLRSYCAVDAWQLEQLQYTEDLDSNPDPVSVFCHEKARVLLCISFFFYSGNI